MLSSTTMVAETIIREGVYGEYSVDVQPQKYDDARSTFKAASETKSKKGTYGFVAIVLSHRQRENVHLGLTQA